MSLLSGLKRPDGSKKDRIRVGRGRASGKGKTCGRGHKGHSARSRGSSPRGFEGGQMPLHRRIPKRGFRNPFKKRYVIVKTGHLKKFPPNSIVDSSTLLARGVIKEVRDGIKILCGGKGVPSGLKVMVHGISKGARLIIEQAGGSVQIIKGRR